MVGLQKEVHEASLRVRWRSIGLKPTSRIMELLMLIKLCFLHKATIQEETSSKSRGASLKHEKEGNPEPEP